MPARVSALTSDARAGAARSAHHPRLSRAGLCLKDETVPLYAGAAHYWRLAPESWRSCLVALKNLGFRLVDVYVPWAVHERTAGELDFGATDPRLDVRRFLLLAQELGLYAIVRPGPHINAELTCFGIPERIVWDPNCQARSPKGRPVVLPVPPLAFPVPSYASLAFQREADAWLRAVGAEIGDLSYPDGPIVLLQIDNEGSMYFRDGVYDQDYHPDAVASYRRFLSRRYETVAALRHAHGDQDVTFARVAPPTSLDAHTVRELARHLDWADFQEQLLADAFSHMRETLTEAGFAHLPTAHNLPLSEGATALDPERIGGVVDLVGLDYYHGASPPQRSEIARRTSGLCLRANARQTPSFACELGAGFPPFFPPLSEADSTFTLLTALAYGLNGFNAYMAVERDRWIGSPIDARGRERESAQTWRRILAALERTDFARLHRDAPVHLVIPRSQQRLARVCHAFGPLSAALFQVMGGGAPEACFEDDFGLGSPVAIDAERFARRLEAELEKARIPFAVVGADLLSTSLSEAAWVVVCSGGALEPELATAVADSWRVGAPVSVGPELPERDHRLLPLERPLGLPADSTVVPALIRIEDVADAVASARQELGLPSVATTPEQVFSTVHRDAEGKARVLFVINPSEAPAEVTLTAAGARSARDILNDEELAARLGALKLRVPARTVRMLELAYGQTIPP